MLPGGRRADERHLIKMGLDGQGKSVPLLHAGERVRIAEHGLEVPAPAPLDVVDNARPVEALVDTGGDESGLRDHRPLDDTTEPVDEALLLLRRHGEYVDERGDVTPLDDLGHGRVLLRLLGFIGLIGQPQCPTARYQRAHGVSPRGHATVAGPAALIGRPGRVPSWDRS